MSIAPQAWPWVIPVALLAVALAVLGRPGWAIAAALLALALAAFFRVPARAGGAPADLVLAPANGTVTRIDRVTEPLVAEGELLRVVTFLSVFNVHVQRAPVAGVVERSVGRPGRKLAAFKPEAGELNAGHLTTLRRPDGDRVGVRQIAGLIARRVVPFLEPGQEVERGELLGLIRFGSRVDLYLPAHYELLVRDGERLIEGETPVARIPSGTAAPTP